MGQPDDDIMMPQAMPPMMMDETEQQYTELQGEGEEGMVDEVEQQGI
jgi:hypothetical protein